MGLLLLCAPLAAMAPAQAVAPATLPGRMQDVVQRYSADRASLDATYPVAFSAARLDRQQRFSQEALRSLRAEDFEQFSPSDKLDYLLLQNTLQQDLHEVEVERKQAAAMAPLLPFAGAVEQLMEAKRTMRRSDAEKSAGVLAALAASIGHCRHDLDAARVNGHTAVDAVTALRAVGALRGLQENLNTWHAFSSGYDPQFTWWTDGPYRAADQAMTEYAAFLKEKLVGIAPGDKTTIIGDPAGRDVLLQELATENIPYTPEEMIAIAQTEYDWCMRETLRASRDMGYGDNWHAAVEKLKTMHVAPGEQPELIRKLVVDGIEFVKTNDLVTVPPLAEETWRMIMMSPERQLVNPFFTGGDEISVSYPTDTMTYAQREMSMRGNNIPFARATAFHEMIPGHFLQFYMAARYHTYRAPFDTPFWVEGNALWWEMLFWDRGFDRTPEERLGALVWRMHRSARILFTMNFHLGKWTPQQCVQFLIDAVGFEPDNATAEVRRSFDGSVGPLYQSAYLTGALQFRALHHELVDSHRMTDREFHDRILHEHAMPIALLRAYLEQQPLTRTFNPQWKFYGDHPTHP